MFHHPHTPLYTIQLLNTPSPHPHHITPHPLQVTQYSHGSIDLLGIQIDAAINGGNSGGPVFNKRGQCCGIAFQVRLVAGGGGGGRGG